MTVANRGDVSLEKYGPQLTLRKLPAKTIKKKITREKNKDVEEINAMIKKQKTEQIKESWKVKGKKQKRLERRKNRKIKW